MSAFPAATGVSIDGDGAVASVSIDPAIYSPDTALKAAYWLTDRAHIHVAHRADGSLSAEIRLKGGRGGDPLKEICGEFCNSLIEFALRERIAAETENVQSALLQRAFIELLPSHASER